MPNAPMIECANCDGCGWTEGGIALQTTCKKCNGAGALPLSPPEEERPAALEQRLRAEADRMAGLYGRGYGAAVALLREAADAIEASRSALKDSFDTAYDLACLLTVERPSLGGASPHRFNDTDREIL